MHNFILSIIKRNSQLFLFLAFFFIFLTCGLYITFFNDCIIEHFDIVLGMDTSRVYSYFWDITVPHNKLGTHPLVLITLHPMLMSINSFVHSQLAATLILQSILASINACLINKIILSFSTSNKFALLGSFIYAFSFSTLMFVSVPENYIFSAFFNILLLHYIFTLKNNESDFTIQNYFVLALLTLMSFGVTLICFLQNFILIGYLFVKKCGFNSKALIHFIKAIGVFFALYITFVLLQKLAYVNPSMALITTTKTDCSKWINYDCEGRVHHAIRGSFICGFYAIKCLSNVWQEWSEHLVLVFARHQNFCRFIPACLFLGLPMIYYFTKFKEFKRNNSTIILLLSLFLLNVLFNFLYDSQECFLFTQNFLPYLIIALMLIMSHCKNRFFEILCYLFLGYQIVTNIPLLHQLERLVRIGADKHYSLFVWIIYSFISTLLLGIILFILKKIIRKDLFEMNTDKKYFAGTILYLTYMIICALFLAIFHGRGC